ncbi:hypothetical protein BDV28DRAFT_132391 [Aspergillus coremiiformis]|uniref:Uncharacterized protein n=1 Tax=Aspergillus coremiiformis TaxID=138285 RepID=A0A5N6ZAF9_9EURO|nr:hypothetical protein BDV28DRAFT_132391 [Aspergillus coremiiformis]
MDSWFTAIQSVYLDVLHSKAESLQFPGDELRSIQYRLINSGGRSVAQHVSQEHNTSVEDATIIDAVAFAGLLMHDICDCRHDNKANEFYNLLTIVSGHHGVQSTDILRRFCVDVWSWALDTGNLWAIHFAGRMLIWQMYIARYQTSILLDNIHPPTSPSTSDPYGDPVLNSLNPLPPSEEPRNFSIRSRCQNVTRYDNLLDDSLKHFEACSHCRGFETATWQERVPIIGAAYKTKYTDITCVNMLATYMVLASPSELWWLPEPTAQYTGPTSEWSPLLG